MSVVWKPLIGIVSVMMKTTTMTMIVMMTVGPNDEDFTANILCSTNRRALSLHIGAVLYYNMSTDAIHYNIIYAVLPLTELPVTVAGSTMVKARFDRLIASEYEHEYELRIWSEELT